MKNLTFRKTDKSHISVHNAGKKIEFHVFCLPNGEPQYGGCLTCDANK